MSSALFWLAVILFAASLFTAVEALYARGVIPILARDVRPGISLPNPPKVSAIVPACNEAGPIEAAVRSLDRSTDETGAIMDRLAQQFPQLRVIHVAHLPDGWLGKNHALWVGAQRATGDLLLFTDADVHFHPTALRRAVGFLQQRQLQHAHGPAGALPGPVLPGGRAAYGLHVRTGRLPDLPAAADF